MGFDSEPGYFELTEALAKTEITAHVRNDMSFGTVTVMFYVWSHK